MSSVKLASVMVHCFRMALLSCHDGLSFGFFAAQLMKASHRGCDGESSGSPFTFSAVSVFCGAAAVSGLLSLAFAEGEAVVAVPLSYLESFLPQ